MVLVFGVFFVLVWFCLLGFVYRREYSVRCMNRTNVPCGEEDRKLVLVRVQTF